MARRHVRRHPAAPSHVLKVPPKQKFARWDRALGLQVCLARSASPFTYRQLVANFSSRVQSRWCSSRVLRVMGRFPQRRAIRPPMGNPLILLFCFPFLPPGLSLATWAGRCAMSMPPRVPSAAMPAVREGVPHRTCRIPTVCGSWWGMGLACRVRGWRRGRAAVSCRPRRQGR
jgi:hypothetical protein